MENMGLTHMLDFTVSTFQSLHGLCRPIISPLNCRHPPLPPVDETSSRTQVNELSTRCWLYTVPPLRLLTCRLNAFCSFASMYFLAKFLTWPVDVFVH